ncbi:MAG: hypothetical protein RL308_636, partial [Bacteroidota bacterium]
MKINKFNLSTFAIIFFFSVNATSQNTTTIQITPEINKKIISKYPWKGINVYHINKQKIKYYGYEMGEVISKKYNEQLNSLNSLKRRYENYKAPLQIKKDDLTLCIELINEYLKSDLKLELKKEFLSQSQELATKHHIINIRTEDFRDLYIYKLD